MTLLCDLRRLGARVLAPVALASALLAACGGGTSQVQTFHPAQLIVLGDENSLIEDDGNADGFKYSINDRSATTAGKCQALPTFAQSVASLYGMVFKQCNPDHIGAKAVSRAQRHAKVDDPTTGLAQQMAAQVAEAGEFNGSDLVTVMIGGNDVIELYERVQAGSQSAGDAVAEAQRRGGHVADQVNAILGTGARVLLFTIPDLGLSPYAINASKTDPGASQLLSQLSYDFNAYLRTRIDSQTYDGRNYALVLTDDIILGMTQRPTAFLSSPANITDPACKVTLGASADTIANEVLACTTTNLVDGATTLNYLWASDRHLGPAAHLRIGDQARSRAINNPF